MTVSNRCPECGSIHEDELNARIAQLTAELSEWKQDAERLATFNYSWGDYVACPFCHNDIHKYDRGDDTFHTKNCPITLHRELVAKYGGENNQANDFSGGENNES